jgi:protein-tyrosine phosphatase
MDSAWIVDCHSHLVPSGDDGVSTVEEGMALLRLARERGTRTLYATPHVHSDWDSYPLTRDRLARYDAAFPTMREQAAAFGLELQRGFEVFPGALAADADRRGYALGDSGCILIEFPGSWCEGVVDEPLQAVWDEALRAERDGLLPVLAHPERCAAIWARPGDVEPFVRRGWPLCLNGSSLTGYRHDARSTETAWRLLDAGFGDLVASDAHRLGRGPALDEAHALIARRFGEQRAVGMFDGSPLARHGQLRRDGAAACVARARAAGTS